ncbi:hypothetical protein [Streptomyces sp. NBC_00459]|uniref:hypothetical protein n=1 Tax=Streptomyces sp. NBC_00459 TaxID=2975749 RepID=UPI002E187E54
MLGDEGVQVPGDVARVTDDRLPGVGDQQVLVAREHVGRRYCDGPITDAEDAVEVAYEHVISGPGRSIWAHREHTDLVDLIDPDAPAHPDPCLGESGARRLTPEPPAPQPVDTGSELFQAPAGNCAPVRAAPCLDRPPLGPAAGQLTITGDEKGPSSPEGLTTRPQVKTFLHQ